MAADLNIKIGVDGTAAISNAKQVGDALKQMGAAGDTAGKQVIDVNIKLSQAMREATTNAAAEKGAVESLGHAMQATGGHASRMGQNIMYAERGAHDILTTFGLASGSANLVGRLARGVDDLMLSVARGGAGMLAFSASMIAFSVAMKAVTSVMDLFKDAMKSAGEEEKLAIGIKDVVGNAKLAHDEMEQLKDFVTGPFAGALKMDDVAEGVRKLQLLTGQLTVTDTQLKAISATAQLNHTSFLAIATQYGRVIEAIRIGNPVRAQLLSTMVGEGLITAQTQAKIETLVKKHADLKTVMAALTEGMKGSEQTNNALADSYDNIVARLGKVFSLQIAEPFGAAIESALKEPIKLITNMLTGHEADIKQMADQLQLSLMTAFYYVRDNGIVEGMQAGLDKVSAYIANTIIPAIFKTLGDAWNSFWSSLWPDFQRDLENIINAARKKWNVPMTAEAGAAAVTKSEQDRNLANQKFFDDQSRLQQEENDRVRTEAGITDKQGQDILQMGQTVNKQDAATVKFGLGTTTFTASTGDFKGSVAAFGEIVKSIPMGGYGGFGQYGGAMGGPMQITHYAYPGEESPDPLTRAGKAAFGKLAEGGAAFSRDIEAMFKSMGGHPLQQFEATLSDGTKLIRYWNDRTAESLRGRVDLFDPRGIYGGLSGATVTSIRPLPGYGPPGRPITPPDISPQDPGNRARAEAWGKMMYDKQIEAQNQAAKAGGATPVPGKEKAAKDLTEQKSAQDALNESMEKYRANLALIEEQRKAHRKTNEEAYKEEQALDKQEIADLDQIKSRLDADYQAAVQAHDTKKAEAYRMEIVKIETELVKLKGHLDEISAKSDFGAQFQAEATKQFQNLEFNGTKAVDAIKSGLDSVGSAFTSIIDGSAKASDAFKQLAKNIIDQLAKIGWEIIESQIMKMLSQMGGGFGSLFGGGAGAGAATVGTVGLNVGDTLGGFGTITAAAQHGGLITGPSGVDKVPSMLTAGEYVLTNRAVDKYGIAMIDAMNKGTWKHFQGGGFVPGTSAQNIPPNQNVSGVGGVQNVTVATTVNVGGTTDVGRPTGSGGGMSKEQIAQFQATINNVVKQQIAIEKRPGGLLNRNTP